MNLKKLLITIVALVFSYTGFGMENSSDSPESIQFFLINNSADEEKDAEWEMPEHKDLEGNSSLGSHPFEFNTPITKLVEIPFFFPETALLGLKIKQFHLSVVIGNCSPPPDFN